MVLLHSIARSEKLWSEASWAGVGHFLAARGVECVLPWGNEEEHARAARIAASIPNVQVVPQLRVDEAGAALAHARAVIGVDTGLMYLAVALEVPVVGIYCGTRPLHHGPLGRGRLHSAAKWATRRNRTMCSKPWAKLRPTSSDVAQYL